MTVCATNGPQINFGVTLSSSGAVSDYNEERGPSLNDLGEGTLDPRPPFTYRPGNRVGTPVYGWPGCFGGPVVDFVPIALNTSGVAASQSASAASGQIALTTSAASSSFRLIPNFVPSTYSGPVSVIMLDGYQGGFAVGQGASSPLLGAGCGFGQPVPGYNTAGAVTGTGPSVGNTTINLWNPLIMGGRALTITCSSNASGNTFVISGFDVYGMQMTQTIAGPNATTVTTTKAFKYILSSGITWTGAGSSNTVNIGVADVFGFPLYVDHPGYIQIWLGPPSSAVQITANGGGHSFGYGSSLYGAVSNLTTGPSTGTAILQAFSSLGDVRGTYTSSLASTGNTATSGSTGFRVTMNISPRVTNLATVSQNSFWGLVGLPQV